MGSLNNTSVNIATAFKAATTGTGGGLVKGGRREDFPPLDQKRERELTPEEGEEEEERDERRDAGSVKDQIGRVAESSASKKRKVSNRTFPLLPLDRKLTLFRANRNRSSKILRSDIEKVRPGVVRSTRRNMKMRRMGRRERNARK
jgi:hypothetical protein